MSAALKQMGLSGDIRRVEVDARVGGKFFFSDMREAGEAKHWGTYCVLDRPRKIEFTWIVDASQENEPSIVTITIEPDGTGSSSHRARRSGRPTWRRSKWAGRTCCARSMRCLRGVAGAPRKRERRQACADRPDRNPADDASRRACRADRRTWAVRGMAAGPPQARTCVSGAGRPCARGAMLGQRPIASACRCDSARLNDRSSLPTPRRGSLGSVATATLADARAKIAAIAPHSASRRLRAELLQH